MSVALSDPSELAEWQYASPTGGFVTSGTGPVRLIKPGAVIRHHGKWVVVTGAASTPHGLVVLLVDGEPTLHHELDSVEIRTDLHITPTERADQ